MCVRSQIAPERLAKALPESGELNIEPSRRREYDSCGVCNRLLRLAACWHQREQQDGASNSGSTARAGTISEFEVEWAHSKAGNTSL